VTAGYFHTCALSASGVVACWGNDGYGQSSVPAAVAATAQVAIVAGRWHTCALSTVGGLACWGGSEYGQTAVPGVVAAGAHAALSAGHIHTCVLSGGGAAACWGWGTYGQTTVPSAVAAGGRVALASGGYHTCALSAGGGLACWGWNEHGQRTVPAAFAASGVALPLLTMLVRRVVLDEQPQLAAIDPALFVDLINGELHARTGLLTVAGEWAREVLDRTQQDLVLRHALGRHGLRRGGRRQRRLGPRWRRRCLGLGQAAAKADADTDQGKGQQRTCCSTRAGCRSWHWCCFHR
jgi:hypothetical protein